MNKLFYLNLSFILLVCAGQEISAEEEEENPPKPSELDLREDPGPDFTKEIVDVAWKYFPELFIRLVESEAGNGQYLRVSYNLESFTVHRFDKATYYRDHDTIRGPKQGGFLLEIGPEEIQPQAADYPFMTNEPYWTQIEDSWDYADQNGVVKRLRIRFKYCDVDEKFLKEMLALLLTEEHAKTLLQRQIEIKKEEISALEELIPGEQ